MLSNTDFYRTMEGHVLDDKLRLGISHWLANIGVNSQPSEGLPTIILLAASLIIALISYVIVKRVVIRAVNLVIRRSKASWDDSFMNFKVLEKVAQLVPIMILDLLVPIILTEHALLSGLFDRLLSVTIVLMFIRASYAALDSINEIANLNLMGKKMPIKSFIQLFKLFLFCVGLIIVVSIISGQSPVYFLSGLGVATGLIMLVFRDPILGFVAGIQLAANRMVSLGDWIQMDKYGANGNIEEISLTTVKVRNFDKTITMIPAYALVQDAFLNWRGMTESGGRRIRRAVSIDVSSIHFLTDEELTRLQRINVLTAYLTNTNQEIDAYNASQQNNDDPANRRQFTNIGVFRTYMVEYLKNNQNIHNDMTLMVRQLDPTPTGLPIQLYIFTTTTDWIAYEGIQSDIFDHIYSVLPEFGLRPFQNPTGNDIESLKGLISLQK